MKSWDRQKNESWNKFEYFSHFRDSGRERSISATSSAFSVEENQLSKIFLKKHWQTRSDEYDIFIESQKGNKFLQPKISKGKNELLKTRSAIDKIFSILHDRIEDTEESKIIKTAELIRLIGFLNKEKNELVSKKNRRRNKAIFTEFSEISSILKSDDKCLELSCDLLERYNEVKNEKK